jgi:hypothetical protein
MGVKSTTRLSRAKAISRAADLHAQLERRRTEAKFTALTDKELAFELEVMNDKVNGGEGFENFVIDDGTYKLEAAP